MNIPPIKNMRKILIIGSGGAGKSTLAIELGRLLDMPVIHLDAFNWQPGWVAMPKDQWEQVVKKLVNRVSWVMDGNYAGTMKMRLKAADTVIFLAFSRRVCLYRMFKRVYRLYGKTRPDLAPGCPEQLPEWQFIRWIWTFPKTKAPKIMEMIHTYENKTTPVILRSPREAHDFLMTIDRQIVDQERTDTTDTS